MYRRILVAVDGSDSSRNAFRQACKVAREGKSWIAVITVIPRYVDQFQTPGTREKVERSLRAEGEKVLAGFKTLAGEEGISITTVLEEGIPHEAIVETAREGSYGLVVTGRHGRGRLERTLVGSVAARVIGHSSKDVLVVPSGSGLSWDRILLCTDGSESSEAALGRALELARASGGSVTAVSVVDVTDEFSTQAPEAVEGMIEKARATLEAVKRKAEKSSVTAEVFVKEGNTHDLLVELARQTKAGVIVMGSHGRTGLKRLLMGSVTEKVIGLAPCPVLVTRQ